VPSPTAPTRAGRTRLIPPCSATGFGEAVRLMVVREPAQCVRRVIELNPYGARGINVREIQRHAVRPRPRPRTTQRPPPVRHRYLRSPRRGFRLAQGRSRRCTWRHFVAAASAGPRAPGPCSSPGEARSVEDPFGRSYGHRARAHDTDATTLMACQPRGRQRRTSRIWGWHEESPRRPPPGYGTTKRPRAVEPMGEQCRGGARRPHPPIHRLDLPAREA